MSSPQKRLSQRPPRVASCEPCRLSKLACDHRHPCSRCVNRDIAHQCVYRKNAFKRIRSASAASAQPQSRLTFESHSVLETPEPAFQVNMYPNPGFQGSSSLKTVLDNLQEQANFHGAFEPNSAASWPTRADESPSNGVTPSMNSGAMIKEGVQLLEVFLGYAMEDAFGRDFARWKGNGLESHVGAFLVQPFLDTIRAEIDRLQQSDNWRACLPALSQRLFEMSSRPVEIHRAMTLQDFIHQYTGQNLRWETVGFILTLAGIAATEIHAPHALYKTEQDRRAVRMNMIHFGNKCVSFCESLDALNDVSIIFLYQTFQLQSVFYGDQSFKTWRRLNDAISALLAAGLHDNAHDGRSTPFFLIEVRKRIFARLYGIDISLATFLGRPPRMSKRFCCINFPLDLDEDASFLTGESLDRELAKLDQNGWNTRGHVRTSAVMRWSIITSMIREDTLELLLGRNAPDIPQRICELRRNINNAWDSLPPTLVVWSNELWLGQRCRQETESLHLIRLYYLQTVFLIEWAAWRHGFEQSHSLFRRASELLAWVNESLIHREQLPNLGFISLSWRVASCALPAAGALALYLLQPVSGTLFQQLDSPSRRQTMENISILVAHIDILHSPNDGNFQLFSQAKRSLQSVMDMLLQPLNPSQLETPSASGPADLSAIDWMVSEHCGFDGGFWVNFPGRLYMGETDPNIPQ